MTIEADYFFQIATSNPERAHVLQGALPGKKSVHIPQVQVDEDAVKQIGNQDIVSIEDALTEVQRISEHKALRDWQTIGGAPGAISQLTHAGKSPDDARGFVFVARMVSDTIRVAYESDDRVRIFNKVRGPDFYTVQEAMSGHKIALLTALTAIVAPLTEVFNSDGSEIEAYMRSVIVMTEYYHRPFTQEEFVAFAESRNMGNLRGIAGVIPFEENPFIDYERGFRVVLFDAGREQVLLSGTTWSLLNREQCVHGAFPEVVGPLFAKAGIPLARVH